MLMGMGVLFFAVFTRASLPGILFMIPPPFYAWGFMQLGGVYYGFLFLYICGCNVLSLPLLCACV